MKHLSIILLTLGFLACFGGRLRAQEEAVDPGAKGKNVGTYLRIANLLPIGSSKLILKRGEEEYMSGIKPGFFLPYSPIDSDRGFKFSVTKGADNLGSFDLKPAKNKDAFHTLVISRQKGKAKAELYDDVQEADNVEKQPGASEPLPLKRLRVFIGGFDFPVSLDAGSIGKWENVTDGLIVDKSFPGGEPLAVTLIYKDQYNETIREYFPLDFEAARSNSVFVSQRGPQRPRVRCYADNQKPLEDEAAAEGPSP